MLNSAIIENSVVSEIMKSHQNVGKKRTYIIIGIKTIRKIYRLREKCWNDMFKR